MVLYDACRAMLSMTELLGVHRGSRSRTLDWVPSLARSGRFAYAAPCPGSLLSHMSALASPDTFIWSRMADAVASVADIHAKEIHGRVERWALDEAALPGDWSVN